MKMKKVTINQYTIEKIIEICKHIGDSKRFVLLRGSIGVGKTLIAKELAKIIVKDDYGFNQEFNDEVWTEQVAVVPFHSGTDYENLIYGLKLTTENKKLKYKATEQVVLNMLSKAESNKSKTYVVILDDVNRGNFAGAMGDVLSAVESDDVGNAIRPGNDKTYTIPENLYIIATFNPTISNPAIDYAWLRRFMVVDIFSDENYIDSLGNIRDRNKSDNFINETAKEKFTDYIFEIYMEIKILFERYFLDNDENVRKQYMIGHGLFMTYDENKTYKKNAKKFSYQLRYCIVPLLYQYVKDGLLDEKAKLDIEAYEHFYDEDYKCWNHEDYKNYNYEKENDDLFNLKSESGISIENIYRLMRYLIDSKYKLPESASFKFFFQNVSMMRNFSTYLFVREKFMEDRNEKAVRTLKKNIINVNKPIQIMGESFYKPGLISLSYETTELYRVIDKSYKKYGQTSPKFVYKQMVNWFIKAYEFNCCVNDHEYDKKKILKILVDINNKCNNKILTEMLKSIAEKLIEEFEEAYAEEDFEMAKYFLDIAYNLSPKAEIKNLLDKIEKN